MADNYEQATMEPTLPAPWFTDEDLALLSQQGWSHERCGTAPDEHLYFYIPDGECYDPDEHQQSWASLFQEKLEQYDKTIILTIMGAYTCSKMRQGEFGGYVNSISWNRERFMGTHELAALNRKELEADLAKPKEEV